MATDIVQLYQDYNIPHQTEGHKHCRPGWVNVECPFCTGNPGLHLGATLDGSTFYCWRCGWHAPSKAIATLLKIREEQAKILIRQYLGIITQTVETKRKVHAKSHKWPTDTGPLQLQHIRYLERRKFDPEQLMNDWNLQGTGPVSRLDSLNYSHRVLAPVIWNGEEVTFQARDITNKHPLKYMACPEEREIMKHKHLIYGRQDKWTRTGICVEGITDVWRVGFNGFCTFGIKYTSQQLRLIAGIFDRVFVWYDDEPQAIENARALSADLEFRGLETKVITTKGDPGGTEQSEVDYIVKQLLR